MERCQVVTCDVPGAFMQADIDKILHLKLIGEIAELLMKVNPSYSKFISYENGKTVIYAELSKALYGTLQASLLFWQDLMVFLTTTLGFTVNPYAWCVVNKDINGQQCTIGWHVNDLKISHVDSTVVEQIIESLSEKYGKEAPLVVHQYLGMRIDYSQPGCVSLTMPKYIDGVMSKTPVSLLKGISTTPATSHLFNINLNAHPLSTPDAVTYHHLIAKLLYLAK